MPMLEVSRLSVQFGQKKIVDGLSFTVEEGQWLMIVCLLYTSDAADE